MTGMTPESPTSPKATPRSPAKYCEKGGQLHTELQQHEQSVRDMQHAIRDIADAEDPSGSRVPRSLHETLQAHLHQRALSRMQWTRHVEKCWDCTLASNQEARPSRPTDIAA
jgi:hypothetical protein